ncbi:MAG: hypothetical protein ACE5KU_05000 [Nitrososphaerales archaeon]
MISVEFALLLVELILLIFTVLLLTFHLKEDRIHKNLIREMGKTTRVLTRQEYFSEVINAFQEAKKSIFGCITGSKPAEGERQTIETIAKNIRELTKNGVEVSFLIPKFTDRLYIGYRYSAAGADIRYNNCVLVNDLRYMIVDERFVLVGIPEAMGEDEPTKKGYRIPSIGIAAILLEHRNPCWNSKVTMRYEEYLKEIIEGVKKTDTRFSFEPLARELDIPIDELKRIDSLKITPRAT